MELVCVSAGEKRKASLLSRTEPSLWYEAAAGLPALPAEAMATATAAEWTESELKARKAVAERALENEAVVFEQELGELVCSAGYDVDCFPGRHRVVALPTSSISAATRKAGE